MKNVADLYPMSPAQHGLLFHGVYDPSSGTYFEQVASTLTGELDRQALARTWQRMLDRHPVLRTAFLWEGLERPLQVVRGHLQVPWREEDWRGIAADEQQGHLRCFLADDRRRGFDFSRAPLLRLTLLRLDEKVFHLIWSFHHLILDGWSTDLLLEEVFACYQAFSRGQEPSLPPRRPFRDYIGWLAQQDPAAAEPFWRRLLSGFREPTPLAFAGPATRPREEGSEELFLELRASHRRLAAAMGRRGLTLNSLVQGLWGLLLGVYGKRREVVFGAVVSGRPEDLDGSGEMIGMFINTLPVRLRLQPERSLADWLRDLQDQQAEARQYQHSSLVEIQALSDLPRGRPLFESTLSFQNYPARELTLSEGVTPHLEIRSAGAFERTSYPLDVTVDPGPRFLLRVMFDPDRFSRDAMEGLAQRFDDLLVQVAGEPDLQVGQLIQHIETREGKRVAMESKQRDLVGMDQFQSVRPQAIDLTAGELVETHPLDGHDLPLVIEPAVADLELSDWAEDHTVLIEEKLLAHGAVLFRGFGVSGTAEFERFAQTVCPHLFHENGEHPRESIDGNVYTPTFYPPEKQLLWHNENSFNHRWPKRILFCCQTPAERGGETPVVDSRRVFEALAPEIREEFARKGVMYTRTYGTGLGLGWQEVFQTTDRAEVEARCRDQRFEFEWRGDVLHTQCVRPAVLHHPDTGEASWFNQAQHWHVSCLDAETRASVETLFCEEELPRNCYLGDGSPIADEAMAAILEVYRELEVSFPWLRGDVLLMDNILAAHGRNPFSGDRKILVAMGEMCDFDAFEAPPRTAAVPPLSASGGEGRGVR